MLKKTVTYTDYNGMQRTEDFYFNLTQAEITEMQLSKDGGLAEKIEKVIASNDIKEIVKIFKDLVLQSYGEKSDDGRYFMKSDEIRGRFASTEAYSEIFMELASDAEKAAEFVNAIIPKDAKLAEKPALTEVAKQG